MTLSNLGLALADAGLGPGCRRADPRPDHLRGGAGAYPLQHVDGRRPAGRRLVAAGQPVRAGTVRAEVDEAAAERRNGEDPSGTS